MLSFCIHAEENIEQQQQRKAFSNKISTLVIHETLRKMFPSHSEIIRLDFSEGLFSYLKCISATG